MSNLPSSPILAVVQWLDQHQQLWSQDPTLLGISAPQALSFKNAVSNAIAKVNAANAARLAARTATVVQNDALRDAKREASDLIAIIKAFIENSGDANLWNAAGLLPPAPRGESPPPNAPTNLVATLDTDGNLTLRWKATQPGANTVYSIRRAFNGGTNYTLLDTVGEKEFVDQTVPLGTQQVSYRVVARRGGQESAQSGTLTVQFGRVQGPGAGVTIVSETFNGKPVNFQQASAA